MEANYVVFTHLNGPHCIHDILHIPNYHITLLNWSIAMNTSPSYKIWVLTCYN